eukprot:CAMPEP_0114592316 /NCGR_PEP_ID=MMETSP0125-20121206/14167_1 /TAXON_ID=485358 ORGANISM="Aristerostoma sp., Strain ATCC 50986" /NCGR_SAMPLE_ID=MMETSP0125 /ASSEMBLY_ACC=CAM_ASM_000245 /LENGTH=70 /DNA_ID=CAMNT_0001790887 /DNA_START=1470 /DNA_END=1682 /DNA_ORIENTATION=-
MRDSYGKHDNELHIEHLQEELKTEINEEVIRKELENASDELDLANAIIVPTTVMSKAPKIFKKIKDDVNF